MPDDRDQALDQVRNKLDAMALQRAVQIPPRPNDPAARPTSKPVGYTISEVAAMTGRNRTTIHRWLARGVCAPIQVPGGKRWCRPIVDRLISGR